MFSSSPHRNKYTRRFGIAAAVVIGLAIFNWLLNLTYYNPAVIVPFYGWLDKHGLGITSIRVAELGRKEDLYPLIPIAELQSNFYDRPRATVIGIVSSEAKLSDGDVHVNIYDEASGRTLIAEIVPEYPLPMPRIGKKIKIWGITRFDIEHRFWELHPVFGWEAAK